MIIKRKDIFAQTRYISNTFYRQSSKNIIERTEEKRRKEKEIKEKCDQRERDAKKKIFAMKSVAGENVIDSGART